MMQTRLCLLLVAAICFPGAAVMTGYTHAGSVGQWVPTSKDKACESNAEGIKSTATRGHVQSAADCRLMCERSGTCMAVDYYASSKTCLLYDDACLTPQSTADGASSFRLMKSTSWTYIDSQSACETNAEGIKQLGAKGSVGSLEECQQACNRRSKCRAADYYRSTQYCIFYSRPCRNPLATHDGASSFKVARQLGAQTVADMKHQMYEVAAEEGTWTSISSQKACQQNDEGILPLEGVGGTLEEKSVVACQLLCTRYGENCKAIDYYRDTNYCVLYAEPCMHPFAYHNGAMSMKLSAKQLPWAPISATKGCESNHDGIKKLAGRQESSLETCKSACESRLDCAAVDYYANTRWCNFYDEACSVPLSTADQVSSFKIVRMKAEDQKTKSMRGSGFSVSGESSSNLMG